MILTSEADARAAPALRRTLIRRATICAGVSGGERGIYQKVVASGLQGTAIRDELKRRRQQALADWKLSQTIINDQA